MVSLIIEEDFNIETDQEFDIVEKGKFCFAYLNNELFFVTYYSLDGDIKEGFEIKLGDWEEINNYE